MIFTKKLGFHREAPRLFFQTADIQPFGFVPGARYRIINHEDGIEMKIDLGGNRTVCKKVVGGRTLSIIDLNGKATMAPFVGYKDVIVSVTAGSITIAVGLLK